MSIFILYVVLSVIFYQDIKYRAVWWFMFPVLFLILLILANFNVLNKNYILNFIYILLLLLIVWVYSWIKLKKITLKSAYNFIGLGDVLIFFALTPLLPFKSFNIFFVSALIFSLLAHKIFKKYFWYNGETIPLAGLISFYTILFHFILVVFNVN